MKAPKKPNITKIVDRIAQATAFLVLFLLASYGSRQILNSLREEVSIALTTVLMLALVYIVFRFK